MNDYIYIYIRVFLLPSYFSNSFKIFFTFGNDEKMINLKFQKISLRLSPSPRALEFRENGQKLSEIRKFYIYQT